MFVRLGLAAAVPVLVIGLTAAPAYAHGAPEAPVSRAVACGPDAARTSGPAGGAPACRAAAAVRGTAAFEQWDNLRIAAVDGRDREVVPDGRLCSGGLDLYHGLDLARADWPATRLTAGARFTFRYAETIPHSGTFKLYVTRSGYEPTRPLRWSDLEARPFLTVTDPPRVGDEYTFSGRLPRDRSGRHLIYTIWQNTSTPDTYYSCSDVVFTRPASGGTATGAAAPDRQATDPAKHATGGRQPTEQSAAAPQTAQPAAPQTGEPAAQPAAEPAAEPANSVSPTLRQRSRLPSVAAGVLAVLLAASGFAVRRRRR